jgi:hypothetical protein
MAVTYIPFESRTGFRSPGFNVSPTGELSAASIDVPSILINGIELLNASDSSVSLGDSITNSSLERLGTLQYLNVDGDVVISNGSSAIISIVNGEVRISSSENTGIETYENISVDAYGVVSSSTSGNGAIFNITRNAGIYSVSVIGPGDDFDTGDTIAIPGTYLGGESPTNDLLLTVGSLLTTTPLGKGISSVTASGAASTSSVGSINNMSIGMSTPAKAKFTEVTVDTSIDVTGDTTVVGNITVTGNVSISDQPTLASHSTRKDYVDNKISALAIVFGA